MLKINAITIPHNKQRYSTLGDYFTDENGVEQFRVSDLGDYRMELAILVHEIVENYLCKYKGIKEQDIMNFDLMFEKERDEGKWTDEEPGDDPRSIYNKEHQIATFIERALISYFGINWEDYELACNKLYE